MKSIFFAHRNLSFCQTLLIKTSHRFGYPVDWRGHCFGISAVALHAILINQFSFFIRFCHALARQNKNTITVEEKKWLDAIQLLQHPNKSDKKYLHPKLPHTGYCLTQKIAYLSKTNLPKANNKKYFPKTVASFCGFYSHTALLTLLSVLEKNFYYCTSPYAFLFFNNEHIVLMHFDCGTKKWILMDANQLPSLRLNKEEMQHTLFKALSHSSKKTTLLGAQLITRPAHYQKIKTHFAQAANDPQWKQIQTIPPKWIIQKTPRKYHHWLSFCAETNSAQQAKTLLERGTDPNISRKPISMATSLGHVKTLDMLLAYGAKTNAHNQWPSALFTAKSHHQPKAITCLKAYDAKMTSQEKKELQF